MADIANQLRRVAGFEEPFLVPARWVRAPSFEL
jgi:hypothetical protein